MDSCLLFSQILPLFLYVLTDQDIELSGDEPVHAFVGIEGAHICFGSFRRAAVVEGCRHPGGLVFFEGPLVGSRDRQGDPLSEHDGIIHTKDDYEPRV